MTLNECLAGLFNELKNRLKLVVVIIWVGNFGLATRLQRFEQQADFRAIVGSLGEATDVRPVQTVHHKNVVKPLKINELKLSRPLLTDIDTVFFCDPNRPMVGRLTGVPSTGSSRIDLPIEAGEASFLDHEAFGERGAANVAEANHEDFHEKGDWELGNGEFS